MDNFRKHNQRSNKRASLDGFVGGGSPKSPDQPRPRLGDFKRVDGFHAVRKGTVDFDRPTATTMSTDITPVQPRRRPLRDTDGNIQLIGAIAEKPKQRRKRDWAGIIKRGAIGVSVIIVLGGGYMVTNGYLKARKVLGGGGNAAALDENVDPTKLNGEGDGRVNILLLGRGGDGHTAPDLTDTILVASIDPVHKEAALVSIPRDLYVKTPSLGSMKINAVYASAKNKILAGKKTDNKASKAEEAGFNAIEDTVEATLGIPIHYHGMIDFEGFKQAIDAIGGIDIDVKTSLYEVMSINGKRYVLDVKTGKQHFDGFRALAYSRSRMSSARGDFDRAERQRLILMGLKDKALSIGTLSNPLKINQLINAFGNHINMNMTIDELMRLYDIGKQIDGSKVESIGLADPPNNYVTTGKIGGQSVVIPRAGANNYKEIQNFIRNKLRDGFLRKEDASIAVYNGTNTTGLAAKTAADLKSYGYNITTTADAPTKGNQKTILVDLRNGAKKYTKHYLEQRLKVTAVTKMPDGMTIDPGTADFAIILGTDEVTRLQN